MSIRDKIDSRLTMVRDAIESNVRKFTGKDKYLSADTKYHNISSKYKKKQEDYQRQVSQLNDQLAATIKAINICKRRIQEELFGRLVNLLSLLKDIEVPAQFTKELYEQQCRNLDSYLVIETRDSLFDIDFDKEKFKTTLLAIFTLGFATRRKAKRSEQKVQDAENAINDEMRQMDAELVRYQTCVENAQQIEHYFDKLTILFADWLDYLEHSMNYLGYVAMRLSKKVTKRSISIHFLPNQQQKELEATITLAYTLSTLIQTKIVIKEDYDNLKDYANKVRDASEKYTAQEQAYSGEVNP